MSVAAFRSERADAIFAAHASRVTRHTDRLFAWLLVGEWIACVGLSLLLSPTTWDGAGSRLHPHVPAALVLGGAVALFPAWRARFRPGEPLTRQVVAVGQMALCALFIHLTDGRIESHFLIFGSLAFLAFYRDWRVLCAASATVLADHLARGLFWPRSVFGVAAVDLWRPLEHGFYVVFEDVFLIASCLRGQREMRGIAERHAQIELQRDVIAAAEASRRHAEAELVRANAELERRVGARTEELHRAKDAAEAASRAKGEFLANMSHEIRTPLAAVQGYAELLLDPRTAEADRRPHLHAIVRSGQHLMSILDNVLDLSKMEAGKTVVEGIACQPAGVLGDVASLARPRALEKGLAFEIAYETPVPETIRSDPTRLRQILLNLVGNAVKFTAAGAVRVLVRCESPGSPSPRLEIEVADTGVGLGPEQVGRLFQPFEQADSSTTRRFGGTGLGLVICQRLAGMLGGSISVRSEPGQGSSFTVEIATGPLAGVPMCERFEESVASPSVRDPAAGDLPTRLSGSILLVEDGKDNQIILAAHLRRAGAAVTLADNGRVAVALCLGAAGRGAPFDLVLMDMQMPELDGYQACAALRSAGYEGPVVALTAHALSGDRARCLDAGCTDFLTKPVSQPRLVEVSARYLHAGEAIVSELAGDAEILEIVGAFAADLPGRASEIQGAVRRADLDAAEHLTHQLRGAAGSYGFPGITEAAGILEDALRRGAPGDALERHADALAALCRRARAAPSARAA